MKNRIRIDLAMAILTQVTAVSHVFDEVAAELGCGPIHYALELDGQLYLVCQGDDAEKMMVVPMECWDMDNFIEVIGEPLSILSLCEIESM